MIRCRKVLFFAAISTVTLLIMNSHTFWGDITNVNTLMVHKVSHFRTKTFIRKKSNGHLKTILLWTRAYESNTFLIGHGGEELFEDLGCEETRCMTTANRTLKSVIDFDAVMFHELEMTGADLPGYRLPEQRYILWRIESAENFLASDLLLGGKLDDYFNWTMTFRHDSDFVLPYGMFLKRKHHPSGKKLDDIITKMGKWKSHKAKKKTKPIAWFASNCAARNKRHKLADSIGKYLHVDIYGKCGNLTCKRDPRVDCYDRISKTYYFYFSFENSNCPDYVTEKLFETMKYDIVPIVYGGADYSSIAPFHSYIDVKDFGSVKNLTHYLKELMNDKAKYASYFWWKDYYEVSNSKATRSQAFCDLCKKLHSPKEPNKSYADIKKWLVYNSQCENVQRDLKNMQ